MKYGLQMYSVRDLTEHDLRGALQQVAEMGYSFVEFAGFMGNSAEDVKNWLEEYGLQVSSTHTPLAELEDEVLDQTIAYHKVIGCKDIIIPYAKLETKEQIDAFVERVNTLIPKLQAEGISLHYHNHDHEFKPNEDGQIIYDEIVARTNVALEIDTYWAYAAGKDPVQMMETLKARVPVIHIKDGLANREGKPLGLGTAPVAAVYKKAVEMGIPMVVESETLQPDGLTEAKICIDYLKSQEA